MMPSTLHGMPRWREVLIAQLRAVGIALHWPTRMAVALVVLASLVIIADIIGNEAVFTFHPEHYALPGLLGVLLPISVWKDEDRFGAALLWTLPVDRFRHALITVLAGWLWLMGAVALLVLWLLAVTLASGATPFTEEIRPLLPAFSYGVTFDPTAIQKARWTAKPLLWFVPFTAATCMYVLASALALGARRPLRWVLGSVPVLFLIVFAVADVADLGANGIDRVLNAILRGRYGVDAFLTARTESLQVGATLTTGDRVVVWRAFPDVGHWAVATLVWTGVGLVALVAAAARHREQRRN